jgi:phage tail-like protein
MLHSPLQNFLLELDGTAVGRLFGMTGGGVEADVIKSASGSPSVHKHIGNVKYQDIVLRCGTAMSRVFYDWIGNSFGGAFLRKSGAVVFLDLNNAPAERLEFRDALITSVEFPQLSAGSKEHAYMTITISPEMTRSTPADHSQKTGVYVSKLAKAWYISDFRLKIKGLESECSHVRSIGPLKLGQKSIQSDTGKEPGTLEYSDLEVTLIGTPGTGFYKWFQGFVEFGKNAPEDEKSGLLEFFAPNLTKSYFELEFTGLGPYKLDAAKRLNPDALLPATYTMYCNAMNFRAGPSAVM